MKQNLTSLKEEMNKSASRSITVTPWTVTLQKNNNTQQYVTEEVLNTINH